MRLYLYPLLISSPIVTKQLIATASNQLHQLKLCDYRYVKLYLLPDRTKSGKRKSAIHRNELNPKFDEKFTFGPLQLAEFEDRILWLSVWHKDRLGRSEFLGEILLPLGQVRHQLLSSDLCQSTSSKWYQLCDRVSAPNCALLEPFFLAIDNHH